MDKMEKVIELTSAYRRNTPLSAWNPKHPCMVLLDSGHGGMVNGKYTTAPAKMSKFVDLEFYEGVWNRAVMWVLAAELYSMEMSYHILTPEDTDITLMERVRRAVTTWRVNMDKKDFKCYYHSIHANAFGIESVNGVEVWTSKGQTKSDVVATLYYRHLHKLGWKMRPDMGDGDVDREEDFYVLKETPMPAILTETGFYTNYAQVQEMMKPRTILHIAGLMATAHVEVDKLRII